MLSSRTSRAYWTHADTAPGYWMIGVLWRVLATSVQTGGSMCLIDQICSRGSGPTRHSHRQDEGLYVARGTVRFSAGGIDMTATAGMLITVPRHTEHSFVVEDDAVLINFYFPGGFDVWLMGSASPALANAPPPEGVPPPIELMKRLSQDYDGMPLTQDRSTSSNPLAPALPAVTSRHTAESLWFQGGRWSILAEGASTGGGYGVFDVETTRDAAAELQIHDTTDVAVYILEGELRILVDDRCLTVGDGSFVFVPRGSVYGIRSRTHAARYIIIHTEAGYERLIRARGTPSLGAGTHPDGTSERTWPGDALEGLRSDIGLRRIVVPCDFLT